MLRSLARRCAYWIGFVVVGLFTILDMVATPVVRPLAEAFAKSPPVEWCRKLARRLPPWAALIFLAVPFAIVEPAKIYGLYLCGDEKIILGIATIVVAYLLGLLLVDTIYDAARPQLLTIGWFASLMDFVVTLRDSIRDRITGSRPWRVARAWFGRIRRRSQASG